MNVGSESFIALKSGLPVPAARGPMHVDGPNSDVDIEKAKIERACQDFESLLLGSLLKSMRETTQAFGTDEKSAGSGIMSEMMDEQLATAIAKGGGLGLSKVLMDQLASANNQDTPRRIRVAPVPATRMPVNSGVPGEAYRTPESESRNRVDDFSEIISRAANQYDLDPGLIRAVIAQESAGRPDVVSPKGAKGLMQLMDSTATEMGVRDSFDPEENVLGGTKYLRKLLDRWDGNLEKALAGYNAGPTAVEKYNGIPPFRETQNYVIRVLGRIAK